MELENICQSLTNIQDVEQFQPELETLDPSVYQIRDHHGNSLLHLLVLSDCQEEMFEIALRFSNIATRNADMKLIQDLFPNTSLGGLYKRQLVKYIIHKLRNCEGEFIRELIVQGWNHRPYLEDAIDNLKDKLNDSFISFTESIEHLVRTFTSLCGEVINESGRNESNNKGLIESIRSKSISMKDIMLSRNQCGLTLHHIAVIFKKYDVMNQLTELCLEHNLIPIDHMGRTALHYLYAQESSLDRDYAISEMSGHSNFDCLDVSGNSTDFYESNPSILKLNFCQEFVKSDLLDFRMQELAPKLSTTESRKSKEGSQAENDYLKQTVGKVLIKAFILIIDKRPNDPIDFLAHFLKFYVTNLDDSKYNYEISSNVANKLTEEFVSKKRLTFDPEIFSPFAKVNRDPNGTPIVFKLLINKLKSHECLEIDWFDIFSDGINFALRDSSENTLIELIQTNLSTNIKYEIEHVILCMINEDNVQALKNLFSCAYYEKLPNIYELCGPDLFDVSRKVVDLFSSFEAEHQTVSLLFSNESVDLNLERNWTNLIKNEMVAYSYNKKGMSVIHMAIVKSNVSLFNYLVNSFPDCLTLKDCFNRNVHHYCMMYDKVPFVKTVDQFYPKGKNEIDCFGNAPKHYELAKSEFISLM